MSHHPWGPSLNLENFKHKIFILGLILSLSWSSHSRAADTLSLDDLGLKPAVADTQTQKLLEERRFMLEQHQLWGLVSVAGIYLTLSSAQDGQLAPEHALWAGVTTGAYAAAAYYGLMAPTLKDTKQKGQTQLHKYLTWVHLPAMLLTVAAGVQAAKQRRDDKPLTGIAKQHKNYAGIAAGSLALSAVLVSFEF